MSFLGFPPEVRNAIYHHVIPSRRLATHQLLDEGWRLDVPEQRAIPGFIFACRQVYEEAIIIFYSRSILEIAPPRPQPHLARVTTSGNLVPDLAWVLDRHFAFLRPEFLRAIQTIHVFSDQREAINAEAYETTLRWLVLRTSVTRIYLSRLLMTRLRRGRSSLDAFQQVCRGMPLSQRGETHALQTSDDCGHSSDLKNIRTIRIFSCSKRSRWEEMRIGELKAALKGRALPELQMYVFYRENSLALLQSDPRWDVRASDSSAFLDKVDAVTIEFDRFARECDIDQQQIKSEIQFQFGSTSGWLYQVIFVTSREVTDIAQQMQVLRSLERKRPNDSTVPVSYFLIS